MGYIMKNKQTAMGSDTTGASPAYSVRPSKKVARPGANLPSTIPATIHDATQKVRYRSNRLRSLAGIITGAMAGIVYILLSRPIYLERLLL
jgi:hypothetical protein